jgi:hypothetical protein
VYALKKGLLLAQAVGCNKVICYSANLNEGGYSIGVATAIVDDFYLMVAKFVIIKFKHNFHEANMVAHELPRLGFSTR